MMIVGLRFGKTSLGKEILLTIPMFAIFLFVIQMLSENEKIFTRNIWRSIPLQNYKLYLVNLLTSILMVVIFVALQPILLQGVLKLELDDLMKIINLSEDGFFLNLDPKSMVKGILNLTDFFAMISLVDLGGLTIKYFFPKLGDGVLKFISYALIFGTLTLLVFGIQEVAIRLLFHSEEALSNSGIFTIILVILEATAGIYLMPYAETKEN